GTNQPWIELFNNGPTNITLDGLSLTKVPIGSASPALQHSNNPAYYWPFPSNTVIGAGQFRVFFLDGQPQYSTNPVLHSSFRLDPTNGTIALARGQQVLDYINYTNLGPNVSYGSYPDGQLFDRQLFYYVTPGASNNPAPIPVAINEWMANNSGLLPNPYGGAFDDWFELYNFGDNPVDLSGYFLTDNLGDRRKSRIPNGIVMPPHTFLLCWADGDVSGTNVVGNAVHAAFKLSNSGEELGLYTPEGLLVDGFRFFGQTANVSQGRYPDGNVGGVFFFMPISTPRTNNVVTNNIFAPVLPNIPNVTMAEGQTLTFTNQATDSDMPLQTLTYSIVSVNPTPALNPSL